MFRRRLFSNPSLRTTVLLLVAGTLSTLVLMILASVLWATRREGAAAVERDFRATDAFLRLTLRERSDSLLLICEAQSSKTSTLEVLLAPPKPSDSPEDRQGKVAAQNDWATVSDLAQSVKAQSNRSDVIITNAFGDELGRSTGDPSQSHRSLAQLPSIRAAIAGKPWTGVVSLDGKLAVAASVPITSQGSTDDRQVWGTLTILSYFDQTLAFDIGHALNCEIAFLDKGRIVGSSTGLSGLPTFPTVPDGDVVILPDPIMVNGVRYFASVHSFSRQHYYPGSESIGVVILRYYDRATELTRTLQEELIFPFVVSLLVAIIAGVMVARSITQPLDSVVDAARELREGGWPQRLSVTRSDEIGLLQTVFNDMTVSLRTAQERLLTLIDTDPLTELDNHRRFQDRLTQEMQRAIDAGEPLALLLIDIDHFQAFNQRRGHQSGDAVLLAIAAQIRAALPQFALAARYGGEEFAVLAPRMTGEEALQLAEQVRAAIAESTVGVTVSVGVADRRPTITTPESLTLAAELALTQAKALGRDRVCGFDAVAGTDADSDLSPLDPTQLHRFLRDGSLATIQALAAAVDAKDPYTQGHSRRVADLAQRMARQMGLPSDEVDLVFTMGTLHDVGKIGVADSVLQKAGRLDNEERLLMETHPVLGEVIVGKAPQLARTLPGIRSHHERWDGKGYPDGLVATDIPLAARILALADTYDAMTSDRPYRKGLAAEVALSEIRKNAGTQFDPELARVFVGMLSHPPAPSLIGMREGE